MAKKDDRQERAVYIISVASELAGVHPQTLRIYERKGLLRPARTAGNTRRYSDSDIDRLKQIQELTGRGINLAGVKMIMDMQLKLERIRSEMEEMNRELDRTRERVEKDPGRSGSEILPLRSTRLPWQESS
jgi:MerR family transcriptional regulator/heat shock protein HspR